MYSQANLQLRHPGAGNDRMHEDSGIYKVARPNEVINVGFVGSNHPTFREKVHSVSCIDLYRSLRIYFIALTF